MFRATSTALYAFGLTIHWYGVIIAAGMALAVWLAAVREKHLGLPRETALDLALLGIPCAVICARLYYVLFSWKMYVDEPVRALFIWEGGMAIYGGIIGGVLAGLFYSRRKRLSFLKLADLAAPSIALGQGIGRWGNFINQEAYGRTALLPWQQHFPISVFIDADTQWHFATFFYESFWCLLIVIFLLLAERLHRDRRDGELFFGYVFLYTLERALVEGLRTDSLYLGSLRISQLLSLAVLIACFVWQMFRSTKKVRPALALACGTLMALFLLSGHSLLALVPACGVLFCILRQLLGKDT